MSLEKKMPRRSKPPVTVIIPARKEPYLRETIDDLYEKRTGQIEVIVILDGWTPAWEIDEYPGLQVVHNKQVQGMRPSVNAAAEIAQGKYLMKLDAHCSIGPGYDKILAADCPDNAIVIPRRYWLNPTTWDYVIDKNGNIGYVDAMSYRWPWVRPSRPRLTARPDPGRAERTRNVMVAEDMGFQGSCWFMTRTHYLDRLGGMSSYGYGTFAEEPEELGLKTWLGPWGGSVLRSKKTWYAHWAKPSSHWLADPEEAGRVTDAERETGYIYSFDHWWYNRWKERAHNLEWLIDKFWPLPGWASDWKVISGRFERHALTLATLEAMDGAPAREAERDARRRKMLAERYG